MRTPLPSWIGALALATPFLLTTAHAQGPANPDQIPGERIPDAAVSPLVVESMADVVARDRNMVRDPAIHGVWNGEDGRWFVPSINVALAAHSGSIAVVNEWGDPRLGIGFGRAVDVERAFVAGHGSAPAPAVVVVGYRGGVEVARTDRLALQGGVSGALTLDLENVDRIEFQAAPATGVVGYFALDDLTFRPHGATVPATVLDFEDLQYRAILTGTRYAGLDWERGTGLRGVIDRDGTMAVGAPRAPGGGDKGGVAVDESIASAAGTSGTTPNVTQAFIGPRQGDPGGGWIPPDTCGAVGPDHFLSVTNANMSAWRKDNGQRVVNVGLDAFFNQTVGDPRAAWDHHAQRYVVLACDFNRTSSIFVGVSVTADPTGSWYTFSFRTDQGTDAGRWPDYPPLGLDQRGLYTSAYMVGSGARMTIWAIDKTNLQGPNPSAPTITAFRSLPWEGAIQPCVTYGTTDPQYLVSRRSSTTLRLRRLTWSGTTPQLFEHGTVSVPSHSSPPDAPALGSSTPLSTIDYRPMNAVFRNGSVWTTQGVSSGGQAAVRWYEIDASTSRTAQVGTITDPVWYYFYGSIAVDAANNVALGFSGSHAGVYGSAFVTARRASDPAGEVAPPILTKAGEGSWLRLDSAGRNRWGDYSLTSVDPVDDLGFWSIQEYAGTGNSWRTWIARVGYEAISYGDGLAGTQGVPDLTAASRPVIGATLTLRVDNSSGPGTVPGVLLVGVAPDSTPVLGGTLLVQPFISANIPITFPLAQLPIGMPNDTGLIGTSIYFQAVQVDAGAAQGLSFTAGLEIVPVSG